jgi:hypothetical protein
MVKENEELDSEGIPDLDGPLPQKEITGDPQEGIIAPRDYKQAPDDYYHMDTLEERLKEEVPDRGAREVEGPARLIDDESETGGDASAQLGDEGGAAGAEDAAVHVVDELPGGVDRDTDSYTGEKL